MLYKRVELTNGQPVQFLGIYATRWPYDSGVEPTAGFVEADESLEAAAERAAQLDAEQDEALQQFERQFERRTGR